MTTINEKLDNYSLRRLSVHPGQLLLDSKNPRFFGENIDFKFISDNSIEDAKLQEFIRQTIFKKYNVQELINSILEIGFLKIDPIIVVQERNFFRVIEGNRRITAIKTILGDIKRKTLEISKKIEDSLSSIEVVILENDFDDSTIWTIQGIRHVSGIRNWGPFQQAELIRMLYEGKGFSYKQIGAVIGLSPLKVSTILKGYYGVMQMMRDPEFSSLATPDMFSHFEQAYSKILIREWLGWDKDKNQYINKENFQKFCKWITSNDYSISRLKLSSRDIRDKMPVVMEHQEAKELFLDEEITLDEAYSIAQTGPKTINNFLKAANNFYKNLQQLEISFEISNEEIKKLKSIKKIIEKVLSK